MATRTFLFVDQVGSTEQLATLGDARAREIRAALFDVLRRAVSESGGVEVDSAGDGLFCAFDGAGDAVDAAVAMQELTWASNSLRARDEQLAVRVGVNTGEPLVREDGGYFGMAVVVAARLCGGAQADEILVTDVVRTLVAPRGDHRFEVLGERELKGVPQPVAVHRISWEPPRRVCGIPEGLEVAGGQPFVGREAELVHLDSALARAAAGARGVVAVSGDHGIGVTSLVAAFARRAVDSGAVVWSGRASQGGALVAWADALAGWARGADRAGLRLALGGRGEELGRLVPGLAPPRPGGEPPSRGTLDPFTAADAIDEVLVRCSVNEPVVVVLDHLEDAEPETLLVLDRLVGSRRGGRVLFLACYVPAEVGASAVVSALAALPGHSELRLDGLRRGEVATLLAAVTGEVPGPARVDAVHAESEGNPYFVVAMALAQRERDLTARVGGAVERAEELRTDLRLQREEISLGLRELEQLRTSAPLSLEAVVEPDGTPPADVPNPFMGLLAFTGDDARHFHGRDLLVAELVARLGSHRFLGVVGASGSGKSSVVRAGLLPALARGALPGSESWCPVVITPGADPAGALLAGLAAVRTPDAGRALLVVDQGEELWTSSDEASRDRFLDLLVTELDDSAGALVVLVLRADYYGRTAAHAALAELLTDSQVLVGPLSARALRSVVEGPARGAGLVLEPGLAQAVVDDAGDAPGALPLVSTALLETWQRRRGRSLTLNGYAEAGGVRRAIARLAEDVFGTFSEEDRPSAQRVLLRMASPGVDGDDVARRAPLAEVTADASSRRVLGVLADRRLVTVGETTAQVAHEALLREWPRLRGWLDADREGRRLHHHLAAAAAEWETAGRDDDSLLRGTRLAAVLEWRGHHEDELTAAERAYLDSSATRQLADADAVGRASQRRRRTLSLLVVVVVAAMLAGSAALVQGRAAQQRATEALARELAAQAVERTGSDERTALQLAAEAHHLDPSVDTESALLSALAGSRYLEGYVDGLPSDALGIDVVPGSGSAWVTRPDGSLRRWSTTTWQPTSEPVPVAPDAYDSELSPRGDLAAVSASDGVHVVDLATGAQLGPVRDELGGDLVHSSFSDDGSVLVLAVVGSQRALLQDAATGALRAELSVATGMVPVVVSRGGSDELFAVGSFGEPVVRRHGLDGVQRGADQVMTSLRYVDVIRASPDGQRYLVCGAARCEQHATDSGELVGVPISHPGSRAYDVLWSPDGARAAVLADDGSITVVDDADPAAPATSTLLGLTGGAAASWLDEHRLLGWSATGGQHAVYDVTHRSPLASVSAPGSFTGATTPDGTGGEWVLHDEQLSRTTARPGEAPVAGAVVDLTGLLVGLHGLARVPGGDRVVVHGARRDPGPDGTLYSDDDVALGEEVRVVGLQTGRTVSTITVAPVAPEALGRVEVSPDGTEVAVGSGPVVRRYDLSTGDELGGPVEVDSSFVGVLAYSSDGSVLAAGGQDGVLRFVERRSGRVVDELTIVPGLALTDQAAVPGGPVVAVASEAGVVALVDLDAHRRAAIDLPAGGTQLQAVAVDAGGARVAALGRDGSLRLWDLASGRTLGPVLPALPRVGAVLSFLPATADLPERLVAWGSNGSQLVWASSPAETSERVCALADRTFTAAQWRLYAPGRPYDPACTPAST